MGRTNLVILFLGLFGCVTLSMMMKHVVTVKKQANVHPAVTELYSVFREQLRKPPALAEEDVHGRTRAVLTVVPKDSVRAEYEPRFAKALGGYFKQFVSTDFEFDALAVVVKRETGERRFDIPVRGRGFSRFRRTGATKPGPSTRELGPTKRSRPAKQPPGTAAATKSAPSPRRPAPAPRK